MSFCHPSFRRIIHAILVGTMLSGLVPSNLNAAIAPEYERMRQFVFALSAGNEAAAKLSPHGLIDRIERVDDSTFRFWAKRCFVRATLVALPTDASPRPGALTDYRISLGDVQCD